MRKNFAQVLREAKIDIDKEYQKLLKLYNRTYEDAVSYYFDRFYFRGTCLSLDEFDKKYGFIFPNKNTNVTVDELIRFAE